MQPALSPKKYIETKARTLPIYKCLVSKGWEKAGMANVMVLRQHVNGNVTGANFLVDLKCLGVKDAHWFFNENEPDMLEKFPISMFEEIDYPLAHNIIYAGYEFALEFGIQPHKDFAVAKYVLEEDTDAIPLIDVETGDDGIPHLIEHHPGQYSDALLKLKKNAGEGNYHYTAAVGSDKKEADDFEDEEDNEEEENVDNKDELSLHQIPDGALNLQSVKKVPLLELIDKELVSSRNETDQVLCEVELQVKFYTYLTDVDYEEPAFIEEEWLQLPEELVLSDGLNESSYEKGMKQFIAMNDEVAEKKEEAESDVDIVEKYLHQNKENVLFLSFVYEVVLFHQLPINRELLNRYLQPFAHLPMIQLLQVMEGLLYNTDTNTWQHIIEATNIQKAFPAIGEPGNEELIYFWSLQIIRHLRSGNLSLAMAYYDLYSSIANVLSHTHLFFFMLKELLPPLEAAVNVAMDKIKTVIEEKEGEV